METLQISFERCCRLCAEEQETSIMIFSAEAEAILLRNKLNKYLLIEVEEDDKLPKIICLKCCTKLQSVCEFIDNTHTAQKVLIDRRLTLDHWNDTNHCEYEEQVESEEDSEMEKYTEMEISVDPMMVLQNCEDAVTNSYEDSTHAEDVAYLHGIDGENVTLKLIRKTEEPSDAGDAASTDSHIKPFPCETCKRGFFTELALKNHSWIHINESSLDKLFKCNICEEIFKFKSDLATHLRDHKIASGTCQLCGRVFRSEKTFANHLAVHMPPAQPHTCKICKRSYKTWSSLRTHSITHSSERPFECHFCKKGFKRNQDLKFHINQHTGAKPYKCPVCEKSFASSGNCYSHRSRMHPFGLDDKKIKRGPGTWRNIAPKENNVLQLRPIAPKTQLTNVKGIFKYKCQICDHSFVRRDNFTYHMYQHTGEKPFQCSLCTDKFVTRKGLLLHHDKEHPSKDRPLALLSRNALFK